MRELILPLWMMPFLQVCVLLVFGIGLLCFFLRKDFIRQLVGLKLMLQSISLGLIITGWQNNDLHLAQSMVVSALILEAVVMSLALTMIIHMIKHAGEDTGFLAHFRPRKPKEDR